MLSAQRSQPGGMRQSTVLRNTSSSKPIDATVSGAQSAFVVIPICFTSSVPSIAKFGIFQWKLIIYQGQF